jgi:hypothetical protein
MREIDIIPFIIYDLSDFAEIDKEIKNDGEIFYDER